MRNAATTYIGQPQKAVVDPVELEVTVLLLGNLRVLVRE